MKETVNILWTGGLESTYRVAELSRRDVVIQPHYVATDRTSVKYELRAIDRITKVLQADSRTMATILPPIVADTPEDGPEYADILQAYELLHHATSFKSTQYRALAKYARRHHLRLEIGLQFSPVGSIVKVLDTSSLIEAPGYKDVLMVDPRSEEQQWASYTLFKDFLFPKSLIHKTKREELDELKAMGYQKIIRHLWTCYTPIFGLPCGHCFPCRSAKKEGSTEMMSTVGNLLWAMKIKIREMLPEAIYTRLSRTVHAIVG